MSGRLAVLVCGDDPITEAGVAAQLRGRPEAYVSDTIESCCIDVVVVVVERLGDQAGNLVRGLRRGGHDRIVVVCANIDDEVLTRAPSSVSTAWCGAAMRRPSG